LQIYLRRRVAAYKRKKYSHIWPINPNAGNPPEGWRGWPEDKQFALVLSHDVDTKRGYENVLRIADIEESLGFRSMFNFVPENYGKISIDLLNELKQRGFGVAVHGLKHDGKLFLSKSIFYRRAPQINYYLKKWSARGFTAPSMLRNLKWMSVLDIDFSISTFDTDPFEPQPDGVGTIFPFSVSNGYHSKSFVEMPYTLPQDFTLFIILQEKSYDIWKQKIRWIAKHGGLALLNTHPDYMSIYSRNDDNYTYDVGYYIQFLEFILSEFQNEVYYALPSDVANLVRYGKQDTKTETTVANSMHKSNPAMSLTERKQAVHDPNRFSIINDKNTYATPRPLNVAMVSYSFYESDNRVRRYAEALSDRGDIVEVISLRPRGQERINKLKGVTIYRIQERVRDERGKFDYLFRILRFFFHSFYLLTVRHLKKKYDLIHVHSVPDFEVFAALIPKLCGAKVVLDIHDIVPELYSNKFRVGLNSTIYKALIMVENLSARFVDHVIISNDLWRNTLCKRSVPARKCTAIMNYPDDSLFYRRFDHKKNDKFIFLYPGTLNFHQGLDLAIEAFDRIRHQAPDAQLHIIGDGPEALRLRSMIGERGLKDCVFLKNPVTLDEIPPIMSQAGTGIIPKRNDNFGGEAFSTKSLEFMSLGIPIIISETKIDRFYFNDRIVKFFEPGNVDDLAKAMLMLYNDQLFRDQLSERAAEFVKQYSWAMNKSTYYELVDRYIDKQLIEYIAKIENR
jgi:glycosyltransferase involved in cell wall biosynthesis